MGKIVIDKKKITFEDFIFLKTPANLRGKNNPLSCCNTHTFSQSRRLQSPVRFFRNRSSTNKENGCLLSSLKISSACFIKLHAKSEMLVRV